MNNDRNTDSWTSRDFSLIQIGSGIGIQRTMYDFCYPQSYESAQEVVHIL